MGKPILVMEMISKSFPGVKALDSVNFTVYENEVMALLGENGAGKSTIIKLLLRFYEPDNGEIRINGEKIQNYRVDSLRARFSIIFQDFITYSLSIKENVIISDLKKENDEDEVWSALRYSGVLTYFKDKKITLETNVGKEYDDNGIELSGGNRQKLAIARAIFRKADFLIMDEPNSALDITAEKDLFDKIKILYKDKGIIMISHRLGNLDFVDKIAACLYGVPPKRSQKKTICSFNFIASSNFFIKLSSFISSVKSIYLIFLILPASSFTVDSMPLAKFPCPVTIICILKHS